MEAPDDVILEAVIEDMIGGVVSVIVLFTVTVTLAVFVLPVESLATAVRVWETLVERVVFQVVE
jgi:hypothetical protein